MDLFQRAQPNSSVGAILAYVKNERRQSSISEGSKAQTAASPAHPSSGSAVAAEGKRSGVCARDVDADAWARIVIAEGDNSYIFAHRAVNERAPSASGVYTIYTSRRWLYVGESDDIRQSLFQHLNEPGRCLVQRGPLSFSFELISAAQRPGRQRALVAVLDPECLATPLTGRGPASLP